MKNGTAILALSLVAACGGADGGTEGDTTMRACTMIGCRSPIAVIVGLVAFPDATGTHAFEVVTPAGTQQCRVHVIANDVHAMGTCTGDAELSFGPATREVEDTSSAPGTVSVRIEAIPGRQTWQLTLPGSHAEVRVTHRRGDVVLGERTATLVYRESRPNGPSCEPVCSQATETWDFTQ